MLSVFDQLDWTRDTDAGSLIQLVSTQLDAQEEIRKRVRDQLAKDYPADALAWLPTVTWSPPTLVPLRSFDLNGIEKWPTWNDTKKIKLFTEKIESGWHKPLVAVKPPGSRYLIPIDGHTRLSVYWKLKRPPLAFVGKTHAPHGPWEGFHAKQNGMSTHQKAAGFAGIHDQLVALAASDSELSDSLYRELLVCRREARKNYSAGHPERVAVERAVRQARKLRPDPVESESAYVEREPAELVNADENHDILLANRKLAREAYPPGHPERLSAERAVRKSRKERIRRSA